MEQTNNIKRILRPINIDNNIQTTQHGSNYNNQRIVPNNNYNSNNQRIITQPIYSNINKQTNNIPIQTIPVENTVQQPQNAKVLACPNCRRKILPHGNKRSFDWKCYVCGHEFDTPFVRSRTYFQQVIGERKKKMAKYDQEGHKIQGQFNIIKVPVVRKQKRNFTSDDVLKREQILKLLDDRYGNIYNLNKKDIRNAALISFLFLTGARVDEVVGVYAYNIEGKRIKDKWQIDPIRKYQISKLSYNSGQTMLWTVENMPVLKRRNNEIIDFETRELKRSVPKRNISLPIEFEKEFIKYIDRYLLYLEKDNDILFSISSTHAWRICYQFNKSYNHFWRHIRATDLVNTYGFQSLQLKHFFGWATEHMSQKYAHLTTDNLVDAMILGFSRKAQKIDDNKELGGIKDEKD